MYGILVLDFFLYSCFNIYSTWSDVVESVNESYMWYRCDIIL